MSELKENILKVIEKILGKEVKIQKKGEVVFDLTPSYKHALSLKLRWDKDHFRVVPLFWPKKVDPEENEEKEEMRGFAIAAIYDEKEAQKFAEAYKTLLELRAKRKKP